MLTTSATILAMTLNTASIAQDETALAREHCLAVPDRQSTGDQSACETLAEQAYDRRLNLAYAKLIRRLPAPVAERLRRSQRLWVAYRDAETLARGGLYATRHGTMYAPMEAAAAAAIVGDRARLLERYDRTLDIEP